MPNTKLMVNSILPRFDPLGKQEYYAGIQMINNRLFEEARKVGYRLIFNKQFYEYDDPNHQIKLSHFKNDGVHLSRQGIIQMAKNIKYNFYRV